jgi:hypothetical protein
MLAAERRFATAASGRASGGGCRADAGAAPASTPARYSDARRTETGLRSFGSSGLAESVEVTGPLNPRVEI